MINRSSRHNLQRGCVKVTKPLLSYYQHEASCSYYHHTYSSNSYHHTYSSNSDTCSKVGLEYSAKVGHPL